MPALASVTAKTIGEFINHAQKLLPTVDINDHDHKFESNWYRGIGSTEHELVPGLYRHPIKKSIDPLLVMEREIVEDFKRQAIFHTEKFDDESEAAELRILFIMQHHGIPTRLLDWSTNPLISLYFALTSAKTINNAYTHDAAVWVLNPYKWNEHALRISKYGDIGPLNQGSFESKSYAPRRTQGRELIPQALSQMHEHPAAILGISNSARMFAQRGVFTIFGRNVSSMETQFKSGGFAKDALRKIIIPKEYIEQLLHSLIRLGFTDSLSYPDLQGVAMEIRRLRGFGG
ncbi:FRG domain-containing protein [Hydrogenophaga sp. ANAO-22]|uniref:FRG domain-containing protein n=1 Tax=Hydrogenophaga sp. ANAO-22 TaxID=3166645 RepID=UPI0036D38D53